MEQEIKKKEVSNWIVLLVGFTMTIVGNFFPQGYAGRTAGTLLDLFGISIAVYAIFKLIKDRKKLK